MADALAVDDFLADQMTDPATQWSLGTFGAIAEFSRDADEPVRLARSDHAVSAVTARGSVVIALREGLRPVASESITKESWNHRLALCLPENHCAMNARRVLTELGPDHDAARAEDRTAILFDLGLDAVQADFCIRLADQGAIHMLRTCAGRSIFEAGTPAMSIILAAQPHRVFMSRVGRIEVYQPIPAADAASPVGPHTHVLPKLLRQRRTHAATEPIPEGWVPCAHLYPRHPAKDGLGRRRPFDPESHEAFQRLLETYGDLEQLALKRRVVSSVCCGQGPQQDDRTRDRFSRTVIRATLRQLKAAGDGSPALSAWMAIYDRIEADGADLDDETDQHG